MGLPARLNLTSIKVRQLKATADLHDDPVFGSPRTDKKWGAETELRCQLELHAYNSYAAKRSGNAQRSDGHATFRKAYLSKKGVTLKVGDRVTAIKDRGAVFTTTEFRITQVRPTGRLPNPLLVIAEFEHDREAKETP